MDAPPEDLTSDITQRKHTRPSLLDHGKCRRLSASSASTISSASSSTSTSYSSSSSAVSAIATALSLGHSPFHSNNGMSPILGEEERLTEIGLNSIEFNGNEEMTGCPEPVLCVERTEQEKKERDE